MTPHLSFFILRQATDRNSSRLNSSSLVSCHKVHQFINFIRRDPDHINPIIRGPSKRTFAVRLFATPSLTCSPPLLFYKLLPYKPPLDDSPFKGGVRIIEGQPCNYSRTTLTNLSFQLGQCMCVPVPSIYLLLISLMDMAS